MKRNIWFTSDTHFNHKNTISYAQRPFESVEEMNEVMIEHWNALVRDEDTIYHLGDFSFGGSESILRILQKLKGRIHLCMGWGVPQTGIGIGWSDKTENRHLPMVYLCR